MEQNNRNSNEEADGNMGVPVHSQVAKIKQELETIKYPSLKQPEMRRVLREINRQRSRSPSPLGLAQRPVSVGNLQRRLSRQTLYQQRMLSLLAVSLELETLVCPVSFSSSSSCFIFGFLLSTSFCFFGYYPYLYILLVQDMVEYLFMGNFYSSSIISFGGFSHHVLFHALDFADFLCIFFISIWAIHENFQGIL